MKTNKVTKLGISLLSVAALGVVAPALTDVPVLGATVVKAEEQQRSINFRISFYDAETGEEIAPEMTGTIRPGESINIHKEISGYQIVSKISWMPNYVITYDMVSLYFHGDPDGYHGMYLDYRKLNTYVKPSETSKPEVKPETNPSDTPKPEVKPETKPSETSKPEVQPETKPSDMPKPGVKPETKPQTNSNTAPQAPVKPVGQDSNTKADKPVSKPETTALPNTGEQNSILGFAGFLLASLGLAGLTYKGRH